MTDRIQDMNSPAVGRYEVLITGSVLLLMSLLCMVAFGSLQQQSAASETLLRELVRYQTESSPISISSTSIVTPNPIHAPISHQAETISFEHLPTMSGRVSNDSTGVYITSFFTIDEVSTNKKNKVFELAAENGNPDNRYFSLIDGSHLIGQSQIYGRGQTVYQVVVNTILDDGTTINFPLDIHIEDGSVTQPSAQSEPAYKNPEVERSISPVFTPEIQHWGAEIVAWGETHRLDPDIVATLMQIESCGNPEAQSIAGAQGLFQVMPHHFDEGENMFAPNINAQRALAYYKQGLALHGGDLDLAFAGYNAGHGTVQSAAQSDWPKETQQYHYWSGGIYREAKTGGSSSETLQEWLAFGGASLCESAAGKLGG
jgi:hypothetical protein